MSRHRQPDPEFLNPPLADAVDAVRAERLDPEAMRRAADRVWRHLADEAAAAERAAAPADPAAAIAGCAGFQAQIPAYVAGTLAPERKLLLEDHSRECVPCRRALNAARRGERPAPLPAAVETAGAAHTAAQPAARRFPRRRLAAAASLLAAAGIAGWLALAPRGPAAVVESADGGALLRVAADGAVTPLAEGAELAAGETVRTARGAEAVVRLADGSAVELAGGTELAVAAGRSDTTVRLDRGLVIVEAAERRRGHLYVSTEDCRVAVTGTIFAVNHGVKGSRVSVIEGEVRVAGGGGGVDVLHPGQQVTTRATLTAVPVAEEVAWSRHHDRYIELLRELEALSRAIEERVERPGLRYRSALAEIAPADTVAYIGMPNLSGQVAEGYAVFREQLATSPVLAAWWAQQDNADGEAEPHLDRVVTALSDFGSYLGDEVAVAFLEAPGLDGGGPVILAEVLRPGFPAYLAQEAERLEAEAGHPVLVPVADPHAAPPAGDGLLVWPTDGLMIAAPTSALLAAAADAASGAAPALPGTPLYERVTAAYAAGVEWLFVGDFGGLLGDADGGATDAAERDRLGLADFEYVVVEHHGLEGSGFGGRAQTTAVLSFSGPRRGVASWLAEPAPMGALDYVSPDASAAFAAVLKEPEAMFDDLLGAALAGDPAARDSFAEARAELGLDPRDDLAAALGGEIAFAVDGPLVPEPSWLLIAEVADPARLQSSLETLVARFNEHEGGAERPGEVTLAPDDPVGGVPAWRISGGSFVEVHYLYNGGYLVAAPSRALLSRALDQRAAGASLVSSAKFRELVPADSHADFSALFYQHMGPVLAPLLGAAGSLSGEMSPEQRQTLAELAAESEPTLAVAYGEPRAIRFAATSEHGAFGLGYRALLGMGSLHTLAGEAARAEAP